MNIIFSDDFERSKEKNLYNTALMTEHVKNSHSKKSILCFVYGVGQPWLIKI
jgi:hypothetical protein